MLEFEDLPKNLQKLLVVWTEPENWGKKLIEICQEAGLKYGSIRQQIHKVGRDDFYELKARMIDKALLRLHDEAIKALAEKVKKGNTRAIELYLKATGRLAERLELFGSVQLDVQMNKLLEAKKKLDELEK